MSSETVTTRPWTHRIYGRLKGTKERWAPLDAGNGRFVVNLIYASAFTEERAKEAIEKVRAAAPNYEFELRKI